MTRTIGFIGGGQMAEAIIKGLVQTGKVAAQQIAVAEPVASRRDHLASLYHVGTAARLPDIVSGAEVMILAVKPQVMGNVLADLAGCYSGQLLITIAAGLPISFYTGQLGDTVPLVRVMPNMGALILEGASALCRNARVSDDDFKYAQELFGAIGTTVAVEEPLMDAVTGLSGSGPAFVFTFIEALIDGGVKTGLSRQVARDLAVQTVYGAAACMKQSDAHPAVLRDRVTSPGGTTASGLQILDCSGFKGTIIEAVEAACNRSRELGEK
ncbi:MAG: pyrroline-5-carboxylate reductase [Desulfofustis sp.]|jgi:pyrroline-5-carboxylate reductase|nr:pyrroline-5-carboxylate reductase [Desulfofustis sp.]